MKFTAFLLTTLATLAVAANEEPVKAARHALVNGAIAEFEAIALPDLDVEDDEVHAESAPGSWSKGSEMADPSTPEGAKEALVGTQALVCQRPKPITCPNGRCCAAAYPKCCTRYGFCCQKKYNYCRPNGRCYVNP